MRELPPDELRAFVERQIRRRDLIPEGGGVVCLVSGGPDSTCLWHALRELGYRVSALHVNHGLRGDESEEDARFCRETLGAEVVDGRSSERQTEDELRQIRYSFATDRLCATGHTATDQVETVLYRLVSSGTPGGIKWRLDLGSGRVLVREYDQIWIEATPVSLEGQVHWGRWRIESELPGLKVRGWRAGDRLAGRRKKIQDVFVDAKIPRSEREAWPLVVRGDEVVAVPGLVEAPGIRATQEEG